MNGKMFCTRHPVRFFCEACVNCGFKNSWHAWQVMKAFTSIYLCSKARDWEGKRLLHLLGVGVGNNNQNFSFRVKFKCYMNPESMQGFSAVTQITTFMMAINTAMSINHKNMIQFSHLAHSMRKWLKGKPEKWIVVKNV